MAVASLTKMTVPLASDQSASAQGTLFPKLKYRFRVTFLGFGVTAPSTELTKQVVDCTRPNVSFESQTIDIYNSKIHYAGKPSWEAINITLRDEVTNNVSRLVGEQLQKQFDFAEQASAASGIDYKFQTIIEILDGGNGADTVNVLETWELYGCFVTTANYGDLNYGTNDPVTIQLTIQYDNALQTPTGTGVGTSVPRTTNVTTTG
jgi:hypothetical protein